MPTPPLKRRNPAVSIRRVQSERKYLTPWHAPAGHQTWKYMYDYARLSAFIPAIGPQPHMIGTSQGVMVRGNPSRALYPAAPLRSEAYLQPLSSAAPQLLLGAYPPSRPRLPGLHRIPRTEEEFLAQERLASFLTAETPPHKPTSLLSYPESHLYESLISRESDFSKDDATLDGLDEESLYQKISIRDSDEAPGKFDIEQSTQQEKQKNSSNFVRDENCCNITLEAGSTSSDLLNECDHKLGSKQRDENIGIQEIEKMKLEKYSVTSVNLGISVNQIKARESQVHRNENRWKRYAKIINFKQSIGNYTYINSSKNYFKSIFKKKKKEEKIEKKQNQTHTVISVVHANPDEQHLPKSKDLNELSDTYFSYDGFREENDQKHGSITDRERKSKPGYSSFQETHRQKTTVIPITVELPESVSQNCFSLEKGCGNDKGVQVCFADLAFSPKSYKEISTLDPLRPVVSTPDFSLRCKNCQNVKRKHQGVVPQNRRIHHSHSLKLNRPHYLRSSEQEVQQNNLSSSKGRIDNRHMKPQLSQLLRPLDNVARLVLVNKDGKISRKKSSRGKENEDLKISSLNISGSDSFVYMSKSPESSQSSAMSSTDYFRNGSQEIDPPPPTRRGGSSGLGSSESDSSFEDDCRDGRITSRRSTAATLTTKKTSLRVPSSVPTGSCYHSYSLSSLQSVGCDSPLSSLSSLNSSRGRLLFDYSWSWSRLNELVRRTPSASITDRRLTSSLAGLTSIGEPSSCLDPFHYLTPQNRQLFNF